MFYPYYECLHLRSPQASHSWKRNHPVITWRFGPMFGMFFWVKGRRNDEKKYETTSSRAYDVYSNVGCRNDELQHPTTSRNFQRKWHKVFDLDYANAQLQRRVPTVSLFLTDIHLIYKFKCSKVACWYKKYRMHFWRKHMIIYNFDIFIYIHII